MPIQDWRQLQNILTARQTGEINPDEPWLEGWDPNAENAVEEYKNRFSKYINNMSTLQGYESTVNPIQRSIIDNPQDYTEEAIALGFGDSRRDKKAPYDIWRDNPNNTRAVMQTQAEKLINGALKAVPYAGTTWADNTIGLILGLQNVLWDAIDEDGEFHPYNSFVDTPFARAMQEVRDISDKILPNYRTQEEVDDADRWWRHINGNFIGDVFLKNLGFTIGAGASAKTLSKAAMRLRGKDVRQAYKAALAATGGEREAVDAFQKVMAQSGKGSKAIGNTFAEAKAAYHKLGMTNQIVGSFGGAIGEARVEALAAAKEHYDEHQAEAQQRYQEKYDALLDDIQNNYMVEQPVYDGFGNIIDTKPVVSETGQMYYETKLAELQSEYNDALKTIDLEARNVANHVFGFNIPLLAGSNAVMFGRMLSGGFKTQVKSKLRGSFGEYKGKGNVATAWAENIGRATTEGMEELSQKIFSEGAKDVASKNMAAFYNEKYDKESLHGVSQWMLSMLETAADVVSDPKSWEEFTVGLLTGALAQIPHKGWKSSIDQVNANKKAAEELNRRIADPEFRGLWEGMVRHNYYEDIKDAALNALRINEDGSAKKADFIWHTVDYKQVFNDVKMFADSGRLEDLEDFVDSIGNLTVEDINKIGNSLIDESDPNFSKKNSAQKLEWLKKRADKVKTAIQQYRNFREDAMDALHTSDEDIITEYALTKAQIQDFENRYRTLAKEVLSGSDYASKSVIENLFGSETAWENRYNPKYLSEADEKNAYQALNGLNSYVKDPSLKRKVEDMGLIVETRQGLYEKLVNPDFVNEFNNARKSVDSVVKEEKKDLKAQSVAEHMNVLKASKTFSEYLNAWDKLWDEEKDAEVLTSVKEEVEKDPDLVEYMNKLKSAEEFENGLSESISKLKTSKPELVAGLTTIQNAFGNLDSNEVLKKMPEGADADIEIAKALLQSLSGEPVEVQNIARMLFEEALNDRAQANGLGVLPVTNPGQGPDNGGGQNPGGNQGGGEGNISTFDHVSKLISAITDHNNTELNAFVKGDFSAYPNLTEKEQTKLMAMAKTQMDKIKASLGMVATDEDGDQNLNPEERNIKDTDPRRVAARAERVRLETQSVKGTPFSIYDLWSLARGRIKKYVAANKTGEKTVVDKARTNATIDWMIAHKTQQFIDTGALYKMNQWYESTHDGEKLPIYFIANPHVAKHIENNPFATSSFVSTVLAVEMTDEAAKALDKFKGDAFSDDTLIDIEGKKYQVIGQVEFKHPDEIKKEDQKQPGAGAAYAAVRKEAEKIGDYAVVQSIKPQYESELKKSGDAAFTDEGRWYVAKTHPVSDIQGDNPDWSTGDRLYTTLNYIQTGRNVTRNDADTVEKVPLKQALASYLKYGGKVHWLIHTANGRSVASKGAPAFPPSIRAVPGSMWMATTEPNGHTSWTHVTIATANEFDFDANKDNPIVQAMDGAIQKLLSHTSVQATAAERKADFEQRKEACMVLSSIFYTGVGNMIQFDYNSGNPYITVGTAGCFSREQFIDTVKAQKLRFEVSVEDLDDAGTMQELLNSGILRSELRDFIRRGASFGINYLVDTDAEGNPVAPHPAKSEHLISSVGNTYVSSSQEGSISNIIIGESGYRLNQKDGTVTRMGGGYKAGEEITDPATVAVVKALGMAMTDVRNLPGRKWIIDVPGAMYQELYEVPVDGMTVHLKRVGKNTKIKPEFNDAEWNALMKAYGIREVTGAANYAEQNDQDVDALMAERDKILAAEEGGSPAPPGMKGRPNAARKRGNPAPQNPTVTEAVQAEEEQEERENCGSEVEGLEEAVGE